MEKGVGVELTITTTMTTTTEEKQRRDGMMEEFSAGLRKACFHQSTHVRAY